MPNRCVVYDCNNTPNLREGIALHKIPFWEDERPEAKKRRKRWVSFVQQKRDKWTPEQYSSICSRHFKQDDFARLFFLVPGQEKPTIPRLIRDEIGVTVYPSIHFPDREQQQQSARSRRRNLKTIESEARSLASIDPNFQLDIEPVIEPSSAVIEPSTVVEPAAIDIEQPSTSASYIEEAIEHDQAIEEPTSCTNCEVLNKKVKQLQNNVQSLRSRLKDRRNEAKRFKRSLESKSKKQKQPIQKPPAELDDDEVTTVQEMESEPSSEPEDTHDGNPKDPNYKTETETTDTETDMEVKKGLNMKDTTLRTEPKHIVFLSKLLLLFQFCHVCKDENPLVEPTDVGTAVIIKITCKNEKCPKPHQTWCSQPNMPGHEVLAGNFLVSMAILLAGASVTKVFRVFSHMGLRCMALNTFFKHQRTKLFPMIHVYWKRCQTRMLDLVKGIRGGIVIAGDGRHDSMGHCAKYGAYSIFCCTSPMIMHFCLVQRNQAGNSPAMELMGFQQCMEFLIGYGLVITTFISDRHTGISSYMKVSLPNITHYFDLWHLKKKIRKVLKKIGKEKGCEEVNAWIKGCENHLYWSALSTSDGNGDVIIAKFNSFLNHIIDQHQGIENPLFNKCSHEENIPHRTWLDKNSVAYDKLKKALTKNSLQKGIMKASPLSQTSCIEGFHSCLNHFAPKMINFSYTGMYCRHIIAVTHFNNNLERGLKHRESDGLVRVKVVYPKFKNGEATVRNVRIQQNFRYVDEMYDTFLGLSQDELKEASVELQDMVPDPMCSVFDKENREAAIAKKQRRDTMVIADVPPTTPVAQVQAAAAAQQATSVQQTARKTRCCRACKKPMKNHNKATCTRNQK